MKNNIHDLPNGSGQNKGKDTKKDPKVLIAIRERVERGTGKSIHQLKNENSPEALFTEALKHVSATKKAICAALGLDIEYQCWQKRKLEKSGKLVQSVDKIICPYTKCKANALTTNERLFDAFRKPIQYPIPFNNGNQ